MSRAVRVFIHICFLTIVVVCIGCGQGADVAFDAQGENSLFVIVEGFNGGNPAVRSLMPNEQHDLTSGGLSFTLSGVSNTGKRVDEMPVNIADGTAVIPLEPMLWNLTLTAYKETAGESIPVLRGFSIADMRTGSASVHFVLSSDGLYGNGTVAIKASIPHHDVAANVTVGVYRKSSPEQAIGTVQEFNTITNEKISLNYTATIPAGNYLFCISCQNAEGKPCGSYCDTLIVEPGLATAREFGTLDIAARLPTAPGGLSASLGDASPDGAIYRVTLSWTCGQYADRYELQLDTGAGTPTVYSADGADGSERFAGAPIYGGGNLLYGSKGCELLLASGAYTVRLRARNEYGVSSDWDGALEKGLTVP